MLSSGIFIALLIIVVFFALMLALDRLNLLEPFGFELSGPFLMWKTKKGRDLIDRIAQKKRFWEIYGDIGIILTAVAMIIIMGLVLFNAIMATEIPAEQAPQAQEILVIPGVNPFIPIGYGILSLAVGIIIHEFSHGILTRVADVKVKALGLIFLVVPLGAFCEPDEEEIEKTERSKRDRMFAAGPTSNIIFGIILFILFSSLFMGHVTPEEDSLMVMEVYGDTPADEAGLRRHDHIMEIDNESLRSSEDLDNIDVNITDENGELREVPVEGRRGEDSLDTNITPGLVIVRVEEDTPAEDILEPGDIISHVENGEERRELRNREKFNEALDLEDDASVNITYWRREDTAYERHTTEIELEDGRLGIGVNYLGMSFQEGDWYPKMLARPLTSAETNTERVQNMAMYISLPLLGLSPVPEEMTGFYEIGGPLSGLPSSVFWILANSIYWVLWLNILLGLFNALPAFPLDGGRLFKDWMESLTEKLGFGEDIQEKASTGLTYVASLTILFLLAWSMIGPRI